MTAAAWTADELDRIGAAEELEIAPHRAGGSLRKFLPIWVVRTGDELYIRSWRGTSGSWFRAVQASHAARIRAGRIDRDVALLDADEEINDAVDAEYGAKYGRYPSYVGPMISPQARATTLKLLPGKERSE